MQQLRACVHRSLLPRVPWGCSALGSNGTHIQRPLFQQYPSLRAEGTFFAHARLPPLVSKGGDRPAAITSRRSNTPAKAPGTTSGPATSRRYYYLAALRRCSSGSRVHTSANWARQHNNTLRPSRLLAICTRGAPPRIILPHRCRESKARYQNKRFCRPSTAECFIAAARLRLDPLALVYIIHAISRQPLVANPASRSLAKFDPSIAPPSRPPPAHGR